jgi:UDP-3-O-[3-hydroxymyristoyl] glucosamine N-acyltransferase
MQFALTLEELSQVVRASRVVGGTDRQIAGIASLGAAGPGDLSFLGNRKYKEAVAASRASAILVPEDFSGEPGAGQAYLFVANPSVALARLCAQLEQNLWPRPAPGIHPSAVVAAEARIDPSASVGALCVIEEGVEVGPGVRLDAGVFLGRGSRVGEGSWLMTRAVVAAACELGRRVRLQPGVVIGSDGFGYEFMEGRHEKVPQVGSVWVGDDVEIGANTTIDRARFARTTVGEGTKIDNLVQIGHNVAIGRHCLICAQVGISGSSTVQDYVIIGGQAGLAGHLTIGAGSKIDGQSGVNSDLEPKSFVKGSTCLPYNLEQRINVLRRRLPDLFKRVDALEQSVFPEKSAVSAEKNL